MKTLSDLLCGSTTAISYLAHIIQVLCVPGNFNLFIVAY